MKFGTTLRKMREENGLQQKEVASAAGISPAMLYRVETGKTLPTEETAKAILETLNIDPQTIDSLLEAVKSEREKKSQPKKEGIALSAALNELIGRIDMTATELSKWIDRPFSSVQAWVSGRLLPSDTTLTTDILPALKKAGASEDDLNVLKGAHLQDSLVKALNLSYLNDDEQIKLLNLVRKYYGKDKKTKTRTR